MSHVAPQHSQLLQTKKVEYAPPYLSIFTINGNHSGLPDLTNLRQCVICFGVGETVTTHHSTYLFYSISLS